MEIVKISPFLSVASQIEIVHVRQIAAQGFRTIINNRPDDEVDNQPRAQELAAEATQYGLIFIDQPVISGKVTIGNAEDFGAELSRVEGPVLAFCRSGTRCTTLWAYNEVRRVDVDIVLSFAKSIGYDLESHKETLHKIASGLC